MKYLKTFENHKLKFNIGDIIRDKYDSNKYLWIVKDIDFEKFPTRPYLIIDLNDQWAHQNNGDNYELVPEDEIKDIRLKLDTKKYNI